MQDGGLRPKDFLHAHDEGGLALEQDLRTGFPA